MGHRRDVRDLRILEMQESREFNGHRKRDERVRRTARLKTLLKKGTLPYTPVIMSWLSHEINKPTTQITKADVDAFVK